MSKSRVTVPVARFIAGVLCLDFANTVDPRHADRREEFLDSYLALTNWSEQAGLLSAQQASVLTRSALADRAGADAVHRRALGLREAIYDVFSCHGAQPREGAIATLNDEAHRALVMADLAQHGEDWIWQWRRSDAPDQMLWPIARSAVDLLLSEQLPRVRECEADSGCGWLFLDVTKNGGRRWCQMTVCGNRAKARRRRQKGRTLAHDGRPLAS